ncbi:MAG: hypothetical protein ACE5GX_14695 [Thermoanaerobaculia bacterium]
MKRSDIFQLALIFPLLAMVSWGIYGPILGGASVLLGGSTALALALIGLGYGILGVVAGWILLKSGLVPDNGSWTRDGLLKGVNAGLLGAGGNLALIVALKLYHRPEVVMPLLFGGVQLGNTVFTCLHLKSPPKRGFALGVLLLIVGVVTALWYRPAEHHAEETLNWWFLPAVALVWVFWGKYGVQVHSSIEGFKKSGMRAMISLSLAYVGVAALAVAFVALGFDPGATVSQAGFARGLIAGLITTLGAWGIVFGNRYVKGGPSIVMPLVFAGAPVVNSFYVMEVGGTPWSAVDPRFWIGIAVIIVGGYLVLTNKPEPKPASAT